MPTGHRRDTSWQRTSCSRRRSFSGTHKDGTREAGFVKGPLPLLHPRGMGGGDASSPASRVPFLGGGRFTSPASRVPFFPNQGAIGGEWRAIVAALAARHLVVPGSCGYKREN